MSESDRRPAGCGCHSGTLCRLCYLAGLPAAAEPPAECRFRGEPLTGHERHELGLSSANWAPCSHPDQPLGKYSCPCTGCGPKCPGYLKETP